MGRGPTNTPAELRQELAQMKAKYDELADEVRAAVDALDGGETDLKLIARRLRTRDQFGAPGWEKDEIIAAGWEWSHRYESSPAATDWNPA